MVFFNYSRNIVHEFSNTAYLISNFKYHEIDCIHISKYHTNKSFTLLNSFPYFFMSNLVIFYFTFSIRYEHLNFNYSKLESFWNI